MIVDGLMICDQCGGVIFPDDGTPVTLEVKGQTHHFHYHNKNADDCLAQKLRQLKQQFAAARQ